MKKIFLFLFVTLLTVSCSDDDNNSIDLSQLEGKWYYFSSTYAGVTNPWKHEPCGRDYIDFVNGYFGKYEILDCLGEEIDDNYISQPYTIESYNIVIVVNRSYNGTITRLNSSELQITLNIDNDADGKVDAIIMNFTRE